MLNANVTYHTAGIFFSTPVPPSSFPWIVPSQTNFCAVRWIESKFAGRMSKQSREDG